ncbi:hypothetical protein ABZ791_37850 [Streptomyces huasconensis]|uniref:Uncharacterized protein n=1 Tax=Streptomyces huasconensis TaxID=1854574 RepID=A0ABV3M769_9ACTN
MHDTSEQPGLRRAMVQLLIVLLALYLVWFVISYLTGGSLGASLTAPLMLLAPGAGIAVIRYKQFKQR